MQNITFDDTKWALVPIEPTEEMCESGFDHDTQNIGLIFEEDDMELIYRKIYKAMISAAPTIAGEKKDGECSWCGRNLTDTCHGQKS